MIEKLTIWPQILVICMLAMAWISSLFLHGKPTETKHDVGKFTFGLIVVVVILGNGGFWKPLGW